MDSITAWKAETCTAVMLLCFFVNKIPQKLLNRLFTKFREKEHMDRGRKR